MPISIITIRGLSFALDTSDWSNNAAARNCAAAMSSALRALPAVELINLHALMALEGTHGEDPRLDQIYKIESAAWRSATASLARPPLFGHNATITAA